MPFPLSYTPSGPLPTGSRPLPDGVQNGTYALRAESAGGTLEIDVREFIGWWKTEQSAFIERVREAEPTHIKLSIASTGGFWQDALALHDFLKQYPATVESEVTGTTASAATMIALSADPGLRRMSSNALYLVHYVRFGIFAFGTVEDLEVAADRSLRAHRKFNAVSLSIYQKATGQSEDDLDALLRLDEWLTAEEADAWGFIDEVYEPGEEDDEEESDEVTARAFHAIAHAPAPSIIKALGLPALPATLTTKPNLTLMPDPTKPTNPAPQPAAQPTAGDPATDPAVSADDLATLKAQMEAQKAELADLKAKNKSLAAARRTAALSAMKQAWIGKLPGTTVEALAELAEKADASGQSFAFEKPIAGHAEKHEATLIERLTALAADVPDLASAHSLTEKVDTGDGSSEEAELIAKSYEAM